VLEFYSPSPGRSTRTGQFEGRSSALPPFCGWRPKLQGANVLSKIATQPGFAPGPDCRSSGEPPPSQSQPQRVGRQRCAAFAGKRRAPVCVPSQDSSRRLQLTARGVPGHGFQAPILRGGSGFDCWRSGPRAHSGATPPDGCRGAEGCQFLSVCRRIQRPVPRPTGVSLVGKLEKGCP
jgi:hypothetical protein